MANTKKSSLDRYSRIWMDAKGALKDAWGRFIKAFKDIDEYEGNEAYKTKIKETDRIIGRAELKNLIASNVCEIVFVRRRPERAPNRPEIRRMLCTMDYNLLTSYNGKISLNFRLPRTGRRIDEVKHNIVVVWDIFMQDYRNVSMDQCHIRQIIPGDDTFWKYYNQALLKMTPDQKMQFMDSVG